jgi:hypothetical protein
MNPEDELFEMEENDRHLRHVLRDASGPARDSAAAERLASAVWMKRHVTERSSAPGLAPSIPWRRAWFVAAAAGLLAALLTPRFHGEAMAVEGEPVHVWSSAGWTEGRSVPAGGWVLAPEGVTTLRGPRGTSVHPGPGSLFRYLPGNEGHIAVEVLRGRVHIEGTGVEAEAGPLRVEWVAGTGTSSFTLRLAEGEATAASDDDPSPERGWTGLVPGGQEPGVMVGRGTVRVRLFASRDAMVLGASEEASAVETAAGAPRRLALNRPFHGEVVEGILAGQSVIGALGDKEEGLSLLLQGGSRGLLRVRISLAERCDALGLVNEAMYLLATRLDREVFTSDVLPSGMSFAPSPYGGEVREHCHRKDGIETRILVLGTAGVLVQRDGVETFHDGMASAFQSHPELVHTFGAHPLK